MLINADAFDPDSGHRGGFVITTTTSGVALRARSQHVDPHTPRQELQRRLIAQAAQRYGQVLNAAQRAGWTVYAANTPWPHPTKGNIFLNPISMYVTANLPRRRAAMTWQDTRPGGDTLATFTTPTFAFDAAKDLVVSFNPADHWASTVGGAMLISILQQTNTTSGKPRTVATFAGAIERVLGPPLTSPVTIPNPFASIVGQTHLVAYRVTEHDGRPSVDTKEPFEIISAPTCTDAYCNSLPAGLFLDAAGLNPILCPAFNVLNYPLTRNPAKACQWWNTGALGGSTQCSHPGWPFDDGWILDWAGGSNRRNLADTPLGTYTWFAGGVPCYPGTQILTVHT